MLNRRAFLSGLTAAVAAIRCRFGAVRRVTAGLQVGDIIAVGPWPERYIVMDVGQSWREIRFQRLGEANSLGWFGSKRAADLAVKVGSMIGPAPTYLALDDVYICDPRDSELVRRMINAGQLPLRRPRRV